MEWKSPVHMQRDIKHLENFERTFPAGTIPLLEEDSPTTLGGGPGKFAVLLRGRFLLSLLELAGTAKLPTGGILVSPLGPWAACAGWLFESAATSSAAFAAAAAFAWAADSGKNCLKSSRRSGAVLKRKVT